MRSTTATRSLALGSILAGALTLGAVQGALGDSDSASDLKAIPRSVQAASDIDQTKTTTVRERGIVLEGVGVWRGQPVRVFVYENQKYGNSLQIVVGDPDGKHAIGAGEGRDAYVIDGVLNVGLDVDGDLAVVKGSVSESSNPHRVTESAPDGKLISTRGTHTPLMVKATFRYRGATAELKFTTAYDYALKSTRIKH